MLLCVEVLDPQRPKRLRCLLWTAAIAAFQIEALWAWIKARLAVLEGPEANAFVFEELLEIANVRQQAVLFALQLLQIATPFRSARHPVGDIALELLLGAVRAAFRSRVAADFADL